MLECVVDGSIVNISKSEHQVLEILWTESPLTVGQIIERLQDSTDWHENTIKTMLTRLNNKGAVARNKDGKRFFYEASISHNAVVDEESEGFLSRFFGGKMAPMIAHFTENKQLSKSDINEIEAILKNLKKDNG